MRNRIRKTVLISAIVLMIGCAYFVLHTKTGFSVPCLFHLVTGLNCPGCGVTRMLIRLLHFDLRSAFDANAFLLIMLPVLFLLFGRYIYRYIRYSDLKGTRFDRIACTACAVLFLAWGVVRNFLHM